MGNRMQWLLWRQRSSGSLSTTWVQVIAILLRNILSWKNTDRLFLPQSFSVFLQGVIIFYITQEPNMCYMSLLFYCACQNVVTVAFILIDYLIILFNIPLIIPMFNLDLHPNGISSKLLQLLCSNSIISYINPIYNVWPKNTVKTIGFFSQNVFFQWSVQLFEHMISVYLL